MTGHATPPPPSPGPRRLTRSRDDRVIGGVAGGLGRYFDVDPIIFRIGFAVTAFVGGLGLVAYLAALVAVPVEGEPEPEGSRRGWALAVVFGVVALWFVAWADVWGGPFWFHPFAVFWLLVLAAVVAIGWRLVERRRGAPGDGDEALRRLALVLGVLVLACAAAVAGAWVTAIGDGEIVAGLVIACGLVLVAASFFGGAGWLVVPALALALPAGVVAAADVEVRGGIGEERHDPGSLAELRGEYRLAVGRLELDLRHVDFPRGTTHVDAAVGLGQLDVIAPPGTCVVVRSEAGIGEVRSFGRGHGGVDIEVHDRAPAPSVPQVLLDADVGVGQVRVVDDPDDLSRPGRHGPFGDDDGPEGRRGGDPCEVAG